MRAGDRDARLGALEEENEDDAERHRDPRVVDVRLIAATHRDLAAVVLREDLYYRLQVVVLRIAPLRGRREDIGPLARRFLEQLSRGERGELGAPPVIAPDAMSKLFSHPWPRNMRELRNVIERALAYSPRPTILRAQHLEPAVGEAGRPETYPRRIECLPGS